MDVSVSDVITRFLSSGWDVYPDGSPRPEHQGDATALIEASLRTGPWFRCPGCDEFGVVGQDPVRAVLFFRFAMDGGYGGAMISDPWRPHEPMLVRWWLTRRHERCAMATVRPWDALPSWALPGTPPAAMTGTPTADASAPAAPGPAWRVSVDPAGVPVLAWRPAAPVCHVVRTFNDRGWDSTELVDMVVEAMTSRGARVLDNDDLVPDSAARLLPLDDWYAQVTGPDAVTVWMPSRDHTALRDRGLHLASRVALLTLTGLPPDWIEAVDTQHRLLLVTVPSAADIDADPCDSADPDPLDQTSVQACIERRQAAGGVVAAAAFPDDARRLAASPGPARHRPTRPPVAPIDVEPLWQLALDRAATLVGDETATTGPPKSSPVVLSSTGEVLGTTAHMLALVLTAYCREHDTTPDQVSDVTVAMLLADHLGWLARWLDVLIEPTTLARRLAIIRGTHADVMNLNADPTITTDVMAQISRGVEETDWRGRSTPTRYDLLKTRARQAVERHWLADTGRLHVGDQVLWLPSSTLHGVRTGHIEGLSYTTWPAPHTAAHVTAHYDIALDHGRRPQWEYADEFLLLLADPTHPRARAQAAYSAGTFLWEIHARLWQIQARLSSGGVKPDDADYDRARVVDVADHSRGTLRMLLEHHQHDNIREILTAVAATGDDDLTAATTDAIGRLQALVPHRRFPGEPVPRT